MPARASNSFRRQVALIALAAVSIGALAILIVRDAFVSAEETLAGEAAQQCSRAAAELARQLAEWAQERGALPAALSETEDVSLRGLAATVLRSYEGLAGGYAVPSVRAILGAAVGGQIEAPRLESSELRLIHSTAMRAAADQALVAKAIAGQDVLVAAAQRPGDQLPVAWTIKRIRSISDPGLARRRWWLVALVLLVGLAGGGLVAMSIRLRRGVELINQGLGRLEQDFSYRVPAAPGEFGSIASAVNRMADRRATLEASMRQQDRLAALGKAVAGVAHEIRNPLNSLRLSLELAQRRLKRSTGSGGEIEGALEEVDRLDRIVTRLLTFGKPGFEDRRVQDLRPLVERVVRVLEPQAAAKGVRIEVRWPDGPFHANIDSGQIEQVLINLLLNGIEASPAGSELLVTGARNGGGFELDVRDFGPGVPEGIRDLIFDPYFTTRQSGNGLGLAVSREFIVNHGGTLELAPSDKGARFLMRLPAAEGVG